MDEQEYGEMEDGMMGEEGQFEGEQSGYGQEMMGEDQYGQEMMGGEYGQEGQMMDMGDMDDMQDGYGEEEEAESLNFDENPAYKELPKLDRMRKIRRQIVRTINEVREAHGATSIYTDALSNKAATEYANWLMSNPEDEAKAKEICKEFNVVGEIIPLVGFAVLEEDEDHQGTLQEQMMDAHGLLLELEYELKILSDAKHTHIGIGFAFDKEKVKVVEFVSTKTLMINQVNESEDGGVEARGVVLNKEIGLYACRLVALSKMTKDIKVVGPANIQFQKNSGNFIVHFPGPIENVFYCQNDLKVLEFYIRRSQIDKIMYGVESQERVNISHLELALTIPMEYMPDPRTVLEDAADMEREAKDRAIRAKRNQEQAMIKQAEKVAR